MRWRSLFDTRLPIIQAPMAGVQGAALAAAASGAGALGSLPCATLGAESLGGELRALSARASEPFNVNFFSHTPPAFDEGREHAWRAALAPYYEELGVDAAAIPSGPGRMPFDHDIADVVEPFKPRVVSFHFGLPEAGLLARVKGWGATVLSSATTVDEARWLEAHGADAIIAQGLEAGGHRGMFLTSDIATQSGTLALLPQIVRAVGVPVIAAGGIAGPEGVAAAIALGAAAVQVGTTFLLCPECTTSAGHRMALQSDAGVVTAVTNLFTGRPARGIMNRLMRELGPISAQAPPFPLAVNAIAPLRAAAESRGSSDFTAMWAGQNTSGCDAVPAATIVDRLAAGTGALL